VTLSDSIRKQSGNRSSGIFRQLRYPLLWNILIGIGLLQAQSGRLPDFTLDPASGEQLCRFQYPRDVSILINAPAPQSFDPGKSTSLLLYALPNGNSTAWTIGKEAGPADDWHFEIQHIGAQTRFLRQLLKDRNLVTVYLETEGKSWPAWRRKHPNHSALIHSLVDSLRSIFSACPHTVTLTGHSGGGSMTFGFLNGVDRIPDYIERIAFLDSDYAYSDELRHGDKLAEWLQRSEDHYLSVLAYEDSLVTFRGKRIVSPTGGTWYRSKKMQRKLAEFFPFRREESDDFINYFGLDGRVQIRLKKNPAAEILHTVQVERNGFIQSIAAGTPCEGSGYAYYGDRAYQNYIHTAPDADTLHLPPAPPRSPTRQPDLRQPKSNGRSKSQ